MLVRKNLKFYVMRIDDEPVIVVMIFSLSGVADLMKKTGLTVLEMEREGFETTMKTASPDSSMHARRGAGGPAEAASAQATLRANPLQKPLCTRR